MKGTLEHFTGALLVFDYFHLVQLFGDALVQIRRRVRRESLEELEGIRCAMFKIENCLNEDEDPVNNRQQPHIEETFGTHLRNVLNLGRLG